MPEADSASSSLPRHIVELPTIDPIMPPVCVGCLAEDAPHKRRLVFRRSDKTLERVCAVHWPYCDTCLASLSSLDRQQRRMTWTGAAQMALVVYIVGAAIGRYDLWWPSVAMLSASFIAFIYFARRARALWGLEWARIEDVYKGGRGAAFSFRNEHYAQRFVDANADGPVPAT